MSGRYLYNLTVIGDCGHLCGEWPQVKPLGGKPVVICDVCTREKYGLDPDTAIWVLIREKPERKKAAPRKKASKPAKLNPWEQMMLDGT